MGGCVAVTITPGKSKKGSKSISMRADKLFNWMVRNCYYESRQDNLERLDEIVEDQITLQVFVTYATAFHIPFKKFKEFIGEPYSFKKHLLPLIEKGLICCVGYKHLSKKELKNWDKVLGLVKDYKLGKSYVRFWIGKSDPNDNDFLHNKPSEITTETSPDYLTVEDKNLNSN